MGFMRRKSVTAVDTEEVRPRNRLSKPMTRRSPTSQRSVASGEPSRKSSRHTLVSSSSQATLDQLTRTLSKKQSGAQLQVHLRDGSDTQPKAPPTGASPRKKGVASLVQQFETAASASQLSLTCPASPSTSLVSAYGSKKLSSVQQKQHMHNIRSCERLSLHKRSKSSLVTPSASLELLVDPSAIPRRRESRYRPGEATRKSSASEEQEQQQQRQQVADKENPSENVIHPPVVVESKGDTGDVQQEWTPPPQVERTHTPVDLNVKSIGRLRLGSLHIVNGRSSPVLSELSRHLISKQLRDVSSEYADSTYSKDAGSDTWEDADIAEAEDPETDEPRTPTRTTFRDRDENLSTPSAHEHIPEHTTPLQLRPHTPIQSPDRTSMMAQSYMNELSGSPFSFGSESPNSVRSVVRRPNVEADSPCNKRRSFSSSPTGSVLHHQPVDEDAVLNEEADPREIEKRRTSVESEQRSIESKPSEAETVLTRDLVFSSALEHQAPLFEPPPSPERGISPDSVNERAINRPPSKVDSGYHSGTSLLSLNVLEAKPELRQEPPFTDMVQREERQAAPETSTKSASPKRDPSPRKFGKLFPIRPAMKKAPATAPVVPTKEKPKIDLPSTPSIPVAAPVSDTSPNKQKEKDLKASKMQKKLHKRRPQSRGKDSKASKEIIVHQLAPCGSTLDIPAIPDAAKANLELRSYQVPELERTFKSQDHVKHQPSMSTLLAPPTDIRFPSPLPQSDDERSPRSRKKSQDRSPSRPRSKSRRRSFLDMLKFDKGAEKRENRVAKEESKLEIADFGDVVASLGSNPYDIAHSRVQSRDLSTSKTSSPTHQDQVPQTNPHNITVNRPRPRSSMTDEEASEFARMRSHSFTGHGSSTERKPVFEHRSGLPGKYLKSPVTEDDAPPMPPLPDQQELRRMSQRYSSHSQYLGTPTSDRSHWNDMQSSDPVYASSPAPPPPAHSPRPAFIDHDYEEAYQVEEEMVLAPPPPPSHSLVPKHVGAVTSPPPPPSHSPRPIDIEADQRDQWEAQAKAWRDRRKSANEALASHRQSLDQRENAYVDYQEEAVYYEQEQEQMYPVIPPRNPARGESMYEEPEQYSYEDDHYHHYQSSPYDHSIQRSHTWSENPHPSYNNDEFYPHYSQSSFQNRQRRHNTWDEQKDYSMDDGQIYHSPQGHSGSRPPNRRSRASCDSRNSFYSHNNCQIDRPFDPPPHLMEDSDDEYGQYDGYTTTKRSPARLPDQSWPQQNHVGYNGYERSYDPQHYITNPVYDYRNDQYATSKVQPSPIRRKPVPQPHYVPSPRHSPQPSHSRSRGNSLVPPSPDSRRPSSRQSQHSHRSFRSNGSAISLAEELHPEIEKRPSPAPDFGRYSGGLSFGYEGRNKGFGGSSGTRSASGKADAMVKGKALKETHGVDLGDVPVIGLLKKVKQK